MRAAKGPHAARTSVLLHEACGFLLARCSVEHRLTRFGYLKKTESHPCTNTIDVQKHSVMAAITGTMHCYILSSAYFGAPGRRISLLSLDNLTPLIDFYHRCKDSFSFALLFGRSLCWEIESMEQLKTLPLQTQKLP